MKSANEQLRDNFISHSFYIERYKEYVLRRIKGLLDKVDNDLVLQIERTLNHSDLTQQRLNRLLTRVRQLNLEHYERLDKSFQKELRTFVQNEITYTARAITSSVIVDLGIVAPGANQVYAAAISQPMLGRFYRDEMRKLERSKREAINAALRIGFTEGETNQQIVRRIKGTSARRYKDGILHKERRHIATMVRTATNHMAAQARNQVAENNSSIIKGVQYVSTLDTRTTDICRDLGGKVFPIDSGPRPPQHYSCRSTFTYVTKSWRELGIDIDEAPEGTRASMNGQVPASLTAKEFLKTQSVEKQNQLIGRLKAKKLRDGTASTRELLKQKHRPISSQQMLREELKNLKG